MEKIRQELIRSTRSLAEFLDGLRFRTTDRNDEGVIVRGIKYGQETAYQCGANPRLLY